MRKLINNKKITFITNILLVIVLVVVFAVGFFPEKTMLISADKTGTVYYSGNKNSKNVSLMFNVYENKEVVNKIIDVLQDNNVKATFFMGGCFADDNEELVDRIFSSGNEIGNHGYFHKDHKKLSFEENKQEIYATDKLLTAFTGQKPVLFAPPSGSYSSATLVSAEELGYRVVMWSKDTIDWRDKDENLVFSRATKNLKNGDLVLMHPKEHTLSVLKKIIDYYKSQGFNIVTVSQNIQG